MLLLVQLLHLTCLHKPKVSREWVIPSPLYIIQNKKGKKWYLNLNNYRNTHYQTCNSVKKKYTTAMLSKVNHLPKLNKIHITLAIHAKDRRKFDVDNIASIHTKFFLDTLVQAGVLVSDDYDHVPSTSTVFIGISKEDPRVDIIIKEIE